MAVPVRLQAALRSPGGNLASCAGRERSGQRTRGPSPFDGTRRGPHHRVVTPSWRPPVEPNPLPSTPRARNHQPAPAPDTEPSESGPSKHRLPRRDKRRERPRDAPAKRNEENPSHDDSHYHRIGGRSVRRDAPHAPPGPHRHPPVLQHERLHQLPRRRSRHGSRDLPDLRLHPPPPVVRDGDPSRRPRSAGKPPPTGACCPR